MKKFKVKITVRAKTSEDLSYQQFLDLLIDNWNLREGSKDRLWDSNEEALTYVKYKNFKVSVE